MSTEADTTELTPEQREAAASELHQRVQDAINAHEQRRQGYSVAGPGLPPPTGGAPRPYYRPPANGDNVQVTRPPSTYSVGNPGIPAWAPLMVVGIFGYLMATGFGYAKSSRRAA